MVPRYKLLILLFATAACLGAASLFGGAKASALSGIYPDCSNFESGLGGCGPAPYTIVVSSGGVVPNDITDSYYKLFFPAGTSALGGNFTVTIIDGCLGGANYSNLNDDAQFRIEGIGGYTGPFLNNIVNCSGNNIVLTAPRAILTPQATYYTNAWEVAIVHAQKINGAGWKAFKVLSNDGGIVTSAESPTAQVVSSSPVLTTPFGVYDPYIVGDPGNVRENNWTFEFAPSCEFFPTGVNTRAAYLRWFDLDWGSAVEENSQTNITIQLFERPKSSGTFTLIWSRSDPGIGDRVYGEQSINYKRDYIYQLKVIGANRKNGLDFDIPFSQMSSIVTCPPPIAVKNPPSISAASNCTGIFGSAVDPDNPSAELTIDFHENGVTYVGTATTVGHNYFFPYPATLKNSATHSIMVTSRGVDASGIKDGVDNLSGLAILPAWTVTCNPPVNFILTPAGSLDLQPAAEEETPNSVIFHSNVTSNVSQTVTTSLTISFTRNGNNFSSPATASRTVSSGTPIAINTTVNIPNPIPGDTFCINVTVRPSTGTINTDGTGQNPAAGAGTTKSSSPPEVCKILKGKPYFKVFGGDVIAGSGFLNDKGKCPASPNGIIKSYVRTDLNPLTSTTYNRGSSSQFAAIALGTITQFYSASQRSTYPKPLNDLSISNDTATIGNSGINKCATDFFDSTRLGAEVDLAGRLTANGQIDIYADVLGSKNHFYVKSASTIPVVQSNIYQHSSAFYFDGDVWIKQNLNYDTGYAYSYDAATDKFDMLYLAIIVRGNIYIDPSVTSLDGLYVAQPQLAADGSPIAGTGVVYTCAPGGNKPPTTTAILNNCGNRLTVTGGLYAQTVKFGRTPGTLNRATNPDSASSTNIAEVINSTPDLWIGELPLVNSGTASAPEGMVGVYDFIVSLPPIF